MLKIDIDGITADELLKLALIGLEQQHRENSDRIAALQARIRLGKTAPGSKTTPMPSPEKKPHRLSPEARARIAAGQKRRWEKAKQAQAVSPAKRGRKPKVAQLHESNVA